MENSRLAWINLVVLIDESNQAKISLKIMQCQGYIFKIALEMRLEYIRLDQDDLETSSRRLLETKKKGVFKTFSSRQMFAGNWSINLPRETDVDVVLDVSENSHDSVCRKVLGKVPVK